MNKENIIAILKSEEMNKKIFTIRTNYSHIMTDFYFFKIFIEALKEFGIDTKIDKVPVIINGVPKNDCAIIMHDINSDIRFKYDEYELHNDILQFSQIQNQLGMKESVNYLIDLFINLLL